MPRPTSVVILENHPLALRTIMTQVSALLPEATLNYAGEEVDRALAVVAPGTLVLLDLTLGTTDSPARTTTRLITAGAIVVIISAHEDSRLVNDAVEAGAYAFIPKRHLAAQLGDALDALAQGRGWLSREFAGVLADAAADRHGEATASALRLFAAGFPDAWIAERVGWPESEVQPRLLAVVHRHPNDR